MDGATPETEQRKMSYFSVVRPLSDTAFPMGFQDLVAQRKLVIEQTRTEQALLNYLVGTNHYIHINILPAMMHRFDPDVLVGHNFIGYDLDVLLHRMKAHNTTHWSRIGRLRRTQYAER